MWTTDIIARSNRMIHFKLKKEDELLTFRDAFHYWKTSATFREFYITFLQSIEYTAYFWEHPPLTIGALNQAYECILHQSNSLAQRTVDTRSFANYIHQSESIIDFYNLGKDAYLVIPTQQGNINNYRHIAEFIRTAGRVQVHDLFKRIADVIVPEIEKNGTIWLNTSGMGVIWLHVRLDQRPKYYQTQAYRQRDFWR